MRGSRGTAKSLKESKVIIVLPYIVKNFFKFKIRTHTIEDCQKFML